MATPFIVSWNSLGVYKKAAMLASSCAGGSLSWAQTSSHPSQFGAAHLLSGCQVTSVHPTVSRATHNPGSQEYKETDFPSSLELLE